MIDKNEMPSNVLPFEQPKGLPTRRLDRSAQETPQEFEKRAARVADLEVELGIL